MINLQQHLGAFTKACQSVPPQPVLLPEANVKFITKMVNDELEELADASTIAEQVDALADAIVYITDTATRFGLPLDAVLDAVHKANMAKVVNGRVIRREDGKILKPDGWVPADIEAVVARYLP